MHTRITRLGSWLLALVLVSLMTGQAQAAILFADDFNYPHDNVNSFGGDTCVNTLCTAIKAHGWNFVRGSCSTYCSMQIVAAPFGRAGSALLYEYQADQDLQTVPTQDAMNSNLIKVFTPALNEIWGRVYFATDVDTAICMTCTASRWFCCGTKLHYFKPSVPGPSWLTGAETGQFIPTPVPDGANPGTGIQEAAICPFGGTPVFKGGGGCLGGYAHNVGTVHVADKQWYCFQYHYKANSSYTTADGVLEMWINGTKVTSVLNGLWVDGTWIYNGSQVTLEGAKIGQIEVYRQHSNHMKRYEAGLVWATTQAETSCGGGVDTTPPAVPTGLTVS